MSDLPSIPVLRGVDSKERLTLIAGLVILSLFLAVVWVFKYPPLLDYSNHLARIHIFENLSHPHFEPFFNFEIGVPTNLAIDGIASFLTLIFPIDVAGRLFISIVIALTLFAPVFLSRVLHGRVTAIALLFAVFVFNTAMLMGFLNFLFGTALAIIGFGVHLLMDKRETKAWKRVLIGSLIAIAVFMSHVYGFAVYAVCIGSYYLIKLGIRDFKTLVLNALQFVPVSVLLAIFVAQSMSTDITAPNSAFLEAVSVPTEVDSPPLRAIDVEGVEAMDVPLKTAAWEHHVPIRLWMTWKKMSRLWVQYGDHAGWLGLFCILLGGLYVRNRVWPTTRSLLVPFAVLMALALYLPPVLWGAHHVHWRFFIPAAMFAAGTFAMPRSDLVTQSSILAGISGLSLLQSGLVYAHFSRADAHQQLVIELFQDIPEGSKVLSIAPSGDPHQLEFPIPFTHMVTLGVIEKNSFVPSMFAYSIQQPLRYRSPYDTFATVPFKKNLNGVDWHKVAGFYDYILILDHDGEVGGSASDWLRRIPIPNAPTGPTNPHIALAEISG